jgi:hypothetical protein
MHTSQPFRVDCHDVPLITVFFDEATNTFAYVVQDPTSKSCAVIY